MRAYFMMEMPYVQVPVEVEQALRSSHVIVPSTYCDPARAADLYDMYFEELAFADELGLDVAVSEHHQSTTSLVPSTSIVAAILTWYTKRARIAIVGVPLPTRNNPLQVAEDFAMLDCLSRGRITLCMVRGVSTEMHPHNINASTTPERMEEAHDLIVNAWTSPEPFSWEGEFSHYRYVNPWPRPYQQPHPPIWWTGTSREHALWAADHKHGYAVFMAPYDRAKEQFDAYRQRYRENGYGEAPADKLAYLGMAYTADTDEQALEESRAFDWYLSRRMRHPGFNGVPGFRSPQNLAQTLLAASGDARGGPLRAGTWSSVTANGTLMTGSPATMIKRITRMHDLCGVGHYLFMGRTGPLPTEKVHRSLELFAKEVYPGVRHLGEPAPTRSRVDAMTVQEAQPSTRLSSSTKAGSKSPAKGYEQIGAF